MDIGSILLISALLVLVILFVSRPFFEQSTQTASPNNEKEQHDLSALLAERERILTSLQELDFDYKLGKIPAEDYPNQRASLVQQGVEVLRRLDEIQITPVQEDSDARLETAIAMRQVELSTPVPSVAVNGLGRQLTGVATADDELEALLAQRRRQRQEKAAGFCPQCGSAVQKSDQFCPKCGATLN